MSRFSTGRGEESAPARAPAELRVAAVLAGARVHVPVVIPRTSLQGQMRLLTRREESALALEVASWLAGLDVRGDHLGATGRMPVSSETAVRLLAVAIRDPGDPAKPLASLEEWLEADDAQIGELYRRYTDLVAELDPEAVDLTPAEAAAIADAVKKKDATALLAFGSSRLSAFMLRSASQPATSATAPSSGGPESSGS
jgi:hypothetical protein